MEKSSHTRKRECAACFPENSSLRLFGSAGIYESTHRRYSIRRNAGSYCMFANRRLVWGKINAVNFVARYVALQPLNLWSHSPQDCHRLPGDLLNFCIGKISRARNFSLDYVFRHVDSPRIRILASALSGFKHSYNLRNQTSYITKCNWRP